MKYWMLLFAFLWVSYGTGMARKTEKIVNNGIPGLTTGERLSMPTVPALWKRMADIIFSGNISRTRAMLFRVSVVIHLMTW